MKKITVGIALLCAPCYALRVVSTSPQLTEILFQLGLGRHVIGTSAGSQYPAEAAALPVIGGLFSPSLEKTFGLSPDLVVLDTHNLNAGYAAALQALGVGTYKWNTQSPEALLEGARLFFELVRIPAPPLLSSWTRCLDSLARQPTKRESLKTYLGFVWQDPPVLLGHGAFLSFLFRMAGFKNVLPERFQTPYVPVTDEWLMQQKVDTVFYLRHSSESEEQTRERFGRWWRENMPGTRALDADRFARASFTALVSLKTLPEFSRIFEPCHETR